MLDNQVITSPGSYRFVLDKPGQHVVVVGRFLAKGKDRLEVRVEIIHVARNTKAHVSLKATVDDMAFVGLYGKVVVKEQARDTESFLEERVLLLSARAKAEAVPDLEITQNQVRCSHAATVGKIDEEQIFYLNSRGIETMEAKKMIAAGFLL